MSFNFREYLAGIHPEREYNITKLAGGIVDFTARAVHVVDADSVPDESEDSSFILKYAPPYVAGRGDTAPMSQDRQTVEACALRLLASAIPPQYAVKTPRLLGYDTEAHVLMISDLGYLPNLTELFSAVGGYSPITGPPERSYTVPTSDEPRTRTYYTSIGTKLGRLFALLHSPHTLECMQSAPGLGLGSFQNPSMRDSVLQYSIKPLKDRLDLFPEIIPSAEVDEIYQIIEDDFMCPLIDDERSFILGDCWTAAVLVDPDSSILNPTIGVVDWEFAAIGKGLHGDIPQLLAHFELLQIAAHHQGRQHYVAVIDRLVDALIEAYKLESRSEGAFWTLHDHESIRGRVLRSMPISQAAEMINCAFWKVWVCSDDACVDERGSHTTARHECVLVKKMVECSVRYLRFVKGSLVRAINTEVVAIANYIGRSHWLQEVLKP